MTPADRPPIEAQRAELLAVYVALAKFGRERQARRATAGPRGDDQADTRPGRADEAQSMGGNQ